MVEKMKECVAKGIARVWITKISCRLSYNYCQYLGVPKSISNLNGNHVGRHQVQMI